ncbi:hypothetical protein OIO90_004483 [Microbotryomycetes sp. JL221]|nr:hypothetical protein OIO90_004483 [Microbotryomycetes sp. JL221]
MTSEGQSGDSTAVSLTPSRTTRTETRHGDVGVLTYERLDPARIEQDVRSTKAGAVVTFVGYTRDEFQGKRVTRLDYESYVPLAIKTIHQVLEQVRTLRQPEPVVLQDDIDNCLNQHVHACCPQTPIESNGLINLIQCQIHHLLGPSPPLTPSIVVTVSAPHRRDAFVACEWLLEQTKRKVQIWKLESYSDGSNFIGLDGQKQTIDKSVWKENFPSPSGS